MTSVAQAGPIGLLGATLLGMRLVVGAARMVRGHRRSPGQGLATAAAFLATAAVGSVVGMERFLLAGGATGRFVAVLGITRRGDPRGDAEGRGRRQRGDASPARWLGRSSGQPVVRSSDARAARRRVGSL